MGIRPIGNRGIARGEHARGQIGVGIQGANHRLLRPDQRAQPRQPVSIQIPVRVARSRICPVRRDEIPIHVARLCHPLKHLRHQGVTSRFGNAPRRRRARMKNRQRVDARCRQALQKAADFVVPARIVIVHRPPRKNPIPLKSVQSRRRVDKRIRLVQQRNDSHAHGDSLEVVLKLLTAIEES